MKRLDYPIVENYAALESTPSQPTTTAASSFDKLSIIRYLHSYLLHIFPLFQWIKRYNVSWFCQDLIAGMTVGVITVPQAMAYARLANLDPQYGLYTSFVGTTLYCLFGTSKDISVGPITTVSLLVGQTISEVMKKYPTIPADQVGATLALMAGFITLIIGLMRLGILVDFIPGPAVGGYMTGSAITIALSQLPALNGTSDMVDTHQPPFQVLSDFVIHLSSTCPDIVFGLLSLIALYIVKSLCMQYTASTAEKASRRIFYYLGIMRAGLVVVIGTALSYAVHHASANEPIRVIKTVPSGFDALGVPHLNTQVIRETMHVIPPMIMMLIMEHVSVAKTFGRLSNYTVEPSQEIVSIGMCNIASAFFGGYPCTGAFSRTAIMNRSGARTPLAAAFSGFMLILALFVLTPAFYYIPDAVLAAIVIHAVSDLVSSPAYLRELWKARAVDFWIWVVAVGVAFISDVETGIYAAVGLALASLLLDIARPEVTSNATSSSSDNRHYLPNCPEDVLVFRPGQSILYPNASHVSEAILQAVKTQTCPAAFNDNDQEQIQAHQAWNECRSLLPSQQRQITLRAIIMDMCAVQGMDSTALQTLVGLRASIHAYTGNPVQWIFVNVKVSVREKIEAFGFVSRQTNNSNTDSVVEISNSGGNVYFFKDMQTAMIAMEQWQ
ncbi:sulfate permease [Lichtheimia corymbifera JMRC:FSU:9682]|uniref:Sulfate permease n=1 Tax=Lichtheimia corymbifera JMRC:FSU:9682 TaxID=1263082 RepID=A0A068RSR7_9FUNG|nr:sulfate permease [Lichtheimia corymbifera JMRC:FSU:9682]